MRFPGALVIALPHDHAVEVIAKERGKQPQAPMRVLGPSRNPRPSHFAELIDYPLDHEGIVLFEVSA